MRERLEYALAWTLLKLLGVLPRRVARFKAAVIASLLFKLQPAWKRYADANLRRAFPDWTEVQRRFTIRRMVRNLGWMAAEFAHLRRYNRANIGAAIEQENFHNFLAAEQQGKGVLFLTGHMGPWELSPFAHALYHKPLHFLVRPIDNPRVDRLVNDLRCSCGNVPIGKNQSARAVLRVLRDGGVVGILADQNTVTTEAVFVDFFGVPAATSSGIARIARHSGAAVVPAFGYWDRSRRKYRLRYEPALHLTRTDDEQADIRAHTAIFNKAIEGWIRNFPSEWFWVHRRWRNRPEGEKSIYSE
jgi:KDO2-lipid IV(A) lauroyltransferase